MTTSRTIWTPAEAQAWAQRQPWLVGANFLPSTAINAIEMWQAETFDPATIDRELGWAAQLGFTSMRVFLHDVVWRDDRDGLIARMEHYLKIAAGHSIGTMFVFFDSCWHPCPQSGPQRDPEPGVHNSYWVQSPGVAVLRRPDRFLALENYVSDVIGHFRADERVQVWDLWNEPDNPNTSSRGSRDLGEPKGWIVAPLLEQTFRWARSVNPTQPLTSGVWIGDWSRDAGLTPCREVQLRNSDVISFHDYQNLAGLQARVAALRRFGKPLLCTEYMARSTGSTFEAILPYLRAEKIGGYNWGFVAGRSQTYFPWDSWQQPYTGEPPVWFHDILHADGRPYRPDEVALIRAQTLNSNN